MAQEKPTPEEARERYRARGREAMARRRLLLRGELPPPDERGIQKWWRERGWR